MKAYCIKLPLWCPQHGYPLPCYKCGMPLSQESQKEIYERGRLAVIKEVVKQIKAQIINAKRNASEVYEAHKQLKPRDKQSEVWHNGYDSALQDLIGFLQSKLKEWGISPV